MAKDKTVPFQNGREQGIPDYNTIAKKKADADHNWGYYSKLVKNYPKHKEEVAHTSHIAKEYPNWRAI